MKEVHKTLNAKKFFPVIAGHIPKKFMKILKCDKCYTLLLIVSNLQSLLQKYGYYLFKVVSG